MAQFLLLLLPGIARVDMTTLTFPARPLAQSIPDSGVPQGLGFRTALPQPLLFFPVPAFDDLAWNGIVCSTHDKNHGPGLRPARTTVLGNEQFAFRIEAFTEHCGNRRVAALPPLWYLSRSERSPQ